MPLVVNTIAPENAAPHSKTLFASLLTNDASKQLTMGPGVTAIQGRTQEDDADVSTELASLGLE